MTVAFPAMRSAAAMRRPSAHMSGAAGEMRRRKAAAMRAAGEMRTATGARSAAEMRRAETTRGAGELARAKTASCRHGSAMRRSGYAGREAAVASSEGACGRSGEGHASGGRDRSHPGGAEPPRHGRVVIGHRAAMRRIVNPEAAPDGDPACAEDGESRVVHRDAVMPPIDRAPPPERAERRKLDHRLEADYQPRLVVKSDRPVPGR
jgi:hypothetical protein